MKKDAEIQKNVMEELQSIPLLNANEIGVAVKQGVVTLSGSVDTYPKKIVVEKAVKTVKGVKGIAENIIVDISEEYKKSDTEIAQVVLNAIEWHSAIQLEQISIVVEDGWVTIDGTADWNFQRKSATKAAESITGVKGITNNISINHWPTPVEIRNKIKAAFERNANIDADKINIVADGNKVYLEGTVNSWAEYDEAERSVWTIPGVSVLENNLQLEVVF